MLNENYYYMVFTRLSVDESSWSIYEQDSALRMVFIAISKYV